MERQVFANEPPPSDEQWAIYDAANADNGQGMVIKAFAGTGKTSTLGGLARRSGLTKEEQLAIAFSKHNAKTFEVKVPEAQASTIHALSLKTFKNTWRYVKMTKDSVDTGNFKMKDITKELGIDKKYSSYAPWEIQGMMSDLVHFCMVSMTPPTGEAVEEMADRFTLRLPGAADETASDLEQIILRARQMFFNGAEGGIAYLNFDEMIYWPTVERLAPAPVHTLYVDEIQDLNNLQREFVGLIPAQRIIGVGDPNQAIMMFAGAESDSFDLFQSGFGLESFPLSTSYRCSKAVVKHAQRLVPGITAADWAKDGGVSQIRRHELLETLKKNHSAQRDTFILCRINAPLVGLCFMMIQRGVRAKIRGRDTGRALCSLVRQVQGRESGMSDFPVNLERWAEKEKTRIFRNGGRRAEALAGAINDKTACLESFYDNLEPTTVDQMCAGINALFTDDTLPGVNLMSGHGSKGLEAHDVYVIAPEKLPLQWPGQSEAQYGQEVNLDYVVRTRAMENLIYVRD